MIAPPVIYPYSEIVSSLDVSLAGSGTSDVSGFIYHPTGGSFVAASANDGVYWSYDFTILSKNQVFSIQAINASGDVSDPSFAYLTYEIEPPVILSPGNPKSISDNIAASGSTNTIFNTLSGNFASEGVIVGDYVVATSGRNKGRQRKITHASGLYLETEAFPHIWSEGDTIKVFSKEDRPSYETNKLKFKASGTIDSSAQAVLFTTDDSLDLVRIYANNPEFYDIDSSNDILIVKVNGFENIIELNHGLGRSAEDIANEINSYFDFTVAFTEKPSPISPSIFFIEGFSVKLEPSNATHFFDMCTGDFNFAKNLTAVGTIGTSSKCSIQVALDDNMTLDVNIDGQNLQYNLPNDAEFNPKAAADSLNEQAGKCVASPGPNNLTLLAEESLQANDSLDFLGLNEMISGYADLDTNENSDDSDWDIEFDLYDNDIELSIFGIDAFGNITDPADLGITYKIDPPTLSDKLEDLVDETDCERILESEDDTITLSGNYDTEGQGVLINGEDIYSADGSWTVDLDLEEGDNDLVIQTLDIFGNTSDSQSLTIPYIDPTKTGASAELGQDGLVWRSLLSPSFSPSDVDNARNFIGNVFRPITSVLDVISKLLKIARAFIVDNVVSVLNGIRNTVQNFVNDVITTLKDLSRGLGIYAISTIPKKSEISDMRDFFNRMQSGGPGRAFDGFIETLIRSFDDIYDPKRPQLSSNVTAGGYALAVADTGGAFDFLETLRQITRIVEREVLDYSIPAPINIRVSSENQRVVLTWQAADSIRPGRYAILRATRSGGDLRYKRLKTNLPKEGQSNFTRELDRDLDTGEIRRDYEEIGSIDFNLGTSTSGMATPQVTTVDIQSDLPTIDSSRFIDRIDFRFVDGIATDQENKERNLTESVLNGTTRFLDAVRDSILVQQASTNTALVNGQTYYYKIVPMFGSTPGGESPELVGTPHAPELVFMERESLSIQMNDEDPYYGVGRRYRLSGSIFNKDTSVIASDPSSNHLEVFSDGRRITPTSVDYAKGTFVIRNQDRPSDNISASFWTKKRISTGRSRLVGRNQGDFTFRNIDRDGNTLEIQVGSTSSSSSNIGLGTEGRTTIPLVQKVRFLRDFNNQENVTLTAEEVASIIRNQTSGLKVTVDRLNRIVLINNQYSDPAIGSSLEIIKGNRILGFNDGDKDSAGTLGVPPDWFRISLEDLAPVMNDIIRYIENNSRSLLRSLEDASNALTEYIDTLIKRIETLNDIIKRLQELTEQLAEVLTFRAGVWMLEIPSRPGGNQYLKNALDTSINRPQSDFAGGVMFVYADGGTQRALKFLFG